MEVVEQSWWWGKLYILHGQLGVANTYQHPSSWSVSWPSLRNHHSSLPIGLFSHTCILWICFFTSFKIFSKFADVRVFQSLVRRWLQDLMDDMKEPLTACFDFKGNLIYSANQITCNLYMPVTQMIDGFSICQVSSVNQMIDCLSKIFTATCSLNSRVINSASSKNTFGPD